MCFHNSMSKKAQELAARYGRKTDVIEIAQDIINEQYHVNAFNFPLCPVVTAAPEIQLCNWGLIPFWTKTEADADEIRRMTLNAKAETIFQKPSFKEPIKLKRCLIPSTGYFEWRHEGDKKIPYFIFLKDEPVFSMAGIYDEWLDREMGEIKKTFAIITTVANPLTAYIHNNPKTGNRMPVIVSYDDEKEWLNPNLNKQEISAFLKSFNAHRMDAYVIENDFLKKNPKDPSILTQRKE